MNWACSDGYSGGSAIGHYTCWANCFGGNTTFTHTYSRLATFSGSMLLTHTNSNPPAPFTAHITQCVRPITYC